MPDIGETRIRIETELVDAALRARGIRLQAGDVLVLTEVDQRSGELLRERLNQAGHVDVLLLSFADNPGPVYVAEAVTRAAKASQADRIAEHLERLAESSADMAGPDALRYGATRARRFAEAERRTLRDLGAYPDGCLNDGS